VYWIVVGITYVPQMTVTPEDYYEGLVHTERLTSTCSWFPPWDQEPSLSRQTRLSEGSSSRGAGRGVAISSFHDLDAGEGGFGFTSISCRYLAKPAVARRTSRCSAELEPVTRRSDGHRKTYCHAR
jgi:hypothetical protein